MSPLLIAAAAATGLFLLARKGGGMQEVVGPSNTHWLVKKTASGGMVFTEVWAKSGQFGPHIDTRVLTYASPAGADMPRTLIAIGKGIPQGMGLVAMKDFGVTAPADASSVEAY